MDFDSSKALQAYYAGERDTLAKEPEIRAELHQLGIVTIQAYYDGVGDSGQIEQLRFFDGSEPAQPIAVSKQTEERVEALLYALLNLRHGGWENNDGAFGSFSWDLTEGTIDHTHNQRYTDHDTSVHEGFEIGDLP